MSGRKKMPGSYYRRRKMQLIKDNEKHAKIMKHFLNENEKVEKDRNSRDAGVQMEITGEGLNNSSRQELPNNLSIFKTIQQFILNFMKEIIIQNLNVYSCIMIGAKCAEGGGGAKIFHACSKIFS